MKSKKQQPIPEAVRIEIPLFKEEVKPSFTPPPPPSPQKLVNMKTIINESLQAFQICLLHPGENKMVLLRPRQSITVHQNQISNMILNLAKRKIIKII
jgi:hypothetical protein